tara:strand:+ start:8623 stop:9408 length:786 start_codon:yes stop_codon:yes gene_type:complete
MRFKLSNKTALICGGSSGIGLAIAQALEKHKGLKIILVSSNSDKLEQAKLTFEKPKEVVTYQTDLSKSSEVDSLIKALVSTKVGIDILINNSGGPQAGDIFSVKNEDWEQAIQNNFLSHLYITNHCIDHMLKKNWGRIINITSTLAVEPSPSMIISASVRAAVSAFSKALSDTVCSRGISVNTICPGGIETERLSQLVHKQAKDSGKSYEDTLKQNASSIPLGRFAKPEEIASLAEYLCCEEAGYITGRAHAFDGSLMKSF